MTQNVSLFIEIKMKNGWKITFWDKGKGKIIGQGKIGKNSSISLDYVNLIEGLEFNLLSVSQMCDKGNKVGFTTSKCNVINSDTGKVTFIRLE